MVTDYDSWHPEHGAVEVTDIITVLNGNADKARDMVQRLPTVLARPHSLCTEGCNGALVAKLDAVAGRMLS